MSQTTNADESSAASLVGNLEIFTLADVLRLLEETRQTGEFQVVGSGIDGRLWLDNGELSNAHVGTATTIGQAVFELACVVEGWFYFTSGLVSSSGQPKVPIGAVLSEVRPQVEEWFELRQSVPLDAVVELAPNPPGDDVQIRGDQWRVLTMIGKGGQSVQSVLDAIDDDPIASLRTLRDLCQAGLIALEGGDPGPLVSPFTAAARETPPAVPATTDVIGSLADVAIMPPPIADDPWTPAPESDRAEKNGVA